MEIVNERAKMGIAAVVGFALFLVLAHPLMWGLPAPGAKYSSITALLALAVGAVFALALPLVTTREEPSPTLPAPATDRLALTCARLC